MALRGETSEEWRGQWLGFVSLTVDLSFVTLQKQVQEAAQLEGLPGQIYWEGKRQLLLPTMGARKRDLEGIGHFACALPLVSLYQQNFSKNLHYWTKLWT